MFKISVWTWFTAVHELVQHLVVPCFAWSMFPTLDITADPTAPYLCNFSELDREQTRVHSNSHNLWQQSTVPAHRKYVPIPGPNGAVS